MSAGHIRARGKGSWELKFESGPRDPSSGKRKIQYVSFGGTKRQAQVKLAELISAVGKGSFVEPSRLSVTEHVRARVDQWQAAGGISAKTAERYRELVDHQLVPHLGTKPLQKLTTLDLEQWHSALRATLSARTIGHAHRILSHALSDAMRHGLIIQNVAALEGAPKVDEEEVQVVPKDRVGDLIDKLRGRAMNARAITSLFTGMRRGEVLALAWRHTRLDAKVVEVRAALEQTRDGIKLKSTKTRNGRRDITS
jgi:integrase